MGIVRPIMQEFPYAWLLFLPFILFATYTVMNLFIGIMVSAISEAQKDNSAESDSEETANPTNAILAELKSLHSELAELKTANNQLQEQLESLSKQDSNK